MDCTLALGAFRIARDAGREGVREREPRIPKPPGCSQGAQRAVFCAVRVADLPAASVLKKFVRLASAFPSPPFGSSDFAGPRRPRLYGFHTGTRSLSNRKGRGRRRGGREREPRIPKPPGCSQGAQRAVFCAVRVADFLAEGAEWGASPGRGGRVGVPPAASVLKKFVRLASTFPSPPFGSSDFAGPRRPRLYGFHTHSEPFESEGTRAAKRYVNGNLGFRNLLGARRGLRGQFSVQSE